MKVALTGASGLIGKALGQALEARGDQVVRLQHGSDWQWQTDHGREPWVKADRLAGTDALVHLAGESIASGRWTARKKRAIHDSRIVGTGLMAQALADLPQDQRPSTLLAISAIGYYGSRGFELLEETALPGEGFLARTCVQWERAAIPASEAQVRVVHPRLGMVLARQGGALPKMLPPFKMGLGGRLGSGQQICSWISLTDVTEGLLFLLDHPQIHGPVNLVAPQTVTNRQFTAMLARALHRPAWLPVPALALKLVFGEMARELMLQSARVIPGVLQQAGFGFTHPTLEQALEYLLDK